MSSSRSSTRTAWSSSRRAADPEVDAAGTERLQRAELLGDHERRVVRQHHAAGADADRRGARGDVADDDRGRGAGDAGHPVVLCQPIAAITPALGVPREVERPAEGLPGVAPFDHRRQIQDGDGNHAAWDAGRPATVREVRW